MEKQLEFDFDFVYTERERELLRGAVRAAAEIQELNNFIKASSVMENSWTS